MRGELNVQEHASRLGEGLFADNVILSLIEFRDKRTLTGTTRKPLRRAQRFLQSAIDGNGLKGSVFRSAHDITAARAYSAVCSGLTTSSVDFETYLKELLDTIDTLLAGRTPTDARIDQLDHFFSRYGALNFQRAKSVLEAI